MRDTRITSLLLQDLKRMEEPTLPSRSDIEEPLLRAIINRRGSGYIIFSKDGRDLEIEIAQSFNLPDEVRDFTSPRYKSKGQSKWRNHIQFVRDDLVKKGEIDSSERNIWRVTEAGYKRVGIPKQM
jgi:hypothetical protein